MLLELPSWLQSELLLGLPRGLRWVQLLERGPSGVLLELPSWLQLELLLGLPRGLRGEQLVERDPTGVLLELPGCSRGIRTRHRGGIRGRVAEGCQRTHSSGKQRSNEKG